MYQFTKSKTFYTWYIAKNHR